MPTRRKPARPRRAGLLGPTTDPELAAIGFTTVEALREAGWEEVCLRWVEAYPLRLNVNAFYGVIAAIEGVDWRDLDEGWRARARALRRRLLGGGAWQAVDPARRGPAGRPPLRLGGAGGTGRGLTAAPPGRERRRPRRSAVDRAGPP